MLLFSFLLLQPVIGRVDLERISIPRAPSTILPSEPDQSPQAILRELKLGRSVFKKIYALYVHVTDPIRAKLKTDGSYFDESYFNDLSIVLGLLNSCGQLSLAPQKQAVNHLQNQMTLANRFIFLRESRRQDPGLSFELKCQRNAKLLREFTPPMMGGDDAILETAKDFQRYCDQITSTNAAAPMPPPMHIAQIP